MDKDRLAELVHKYKKLGLEVLPPGPVRKKPKLPPGKANCPLSRGCKKKGNCDPSACTTINKARFIFDE